MILPRVGRRGSGRGDVRELFRDRNFTLMLVGQAATLLGDALVPTTVVIAILKAGGSSGSIAVVLGVSAATRVVITLFGGVLGDRVQRRRLMLRCDATLLVVQGAMTAILFVAVPSVAVFVVASFIYAVVSGFYRPALRGLLVEAVPQKRLIRTANGVYATAENVADILGPALAGGIAVLLSPAWAYGLDACTFAVSATCLALMSLPALPSTEMKSYLSDLVAGWREVRQRSWFVAGVTVQGISNLGFCALLVGGPPVVARIGGGAPAWAFVTLALAVGGILGGLATVKIAPRSPLVAAMVASTLLSLPLLATSIEPSLSLIAVAAAVGMAGATVGNQLWVTCVQVSVAPDRISRYFSYDLVVSLAVMPIGYALAPVFSAHWGDAALLRIGAVLVVVPALVAAASPAMRGFATEATRIGQLEQAGKDM